MKKPTSSFIISTAFSIQLSILLLILCCSTFAMFDAVDAWSNSLPRFVRRRLSSSFTPTASSSKSTRSSSSESSASSTKSPNFFAAKPTSDETERVSSSPFSSLSHPHRPRLEKDTIVIRATKSKAILEHKEKHPMNNGVVGTGSKNRRFRRGTNIIKVPIAMIAKRRQKANPKKKIKLRLLRDRKPFRYNADDGEDNDDEDLLIGDFVNNGSQEMTPKINQYQGEDVELRTKLTLDVSTKYAVNPPLVQSTLKDDAPASTKISNEHSFEASSANGDLQSVSKINDTKKLASSSKLSSLSQPAAFTSLVGQKMKLLRSDTETQLLTTSGVTAASNTATDKKVIIRSVEQLQKEVLDNGKKLQELEFDVSCFTTKDSARSKAKDLRKRPTSKASTKNVDHVSRPDHNNIRHYPEAASVGGHDVPLPFNHEVLRLLEERYKAKSKPGSRSNDDKNHLALSIEGGGMRGAVSAGMASAIAVLGLSDCFDSIYGSSAGSVIGAYMISRQMCLDVYTQILTTAKTKFVSKKRLISSLVSNLIDSAVNNTIFSSSLSSSPPSTSSLLSSKLITPPLLRRRPQPPAMNISYVLDSIMCPKNGLRPLDLEMFQQNDKLQQLRIVTSCLRDGRMETHCMGSRDGDFFDVLHNETGQILESATTMVIDQEEESGRKQGVHNKRRHRHGLFACLESSMTVPAATGPPVPLLRNKDSQTNTISRCFDAFCYEPIPYRSAVEEGATHVLVLKTRPEGNVIGTKPGLFEKVFAPLYFDGNDMPLVAKYFENGGQQYIYVEDYLVLEKGKNAGQEGVAVPPRKILYGVEKDDEAESYIQNRDEWKKAHLLPVSVPPGTPELSVLSVETDEVLEAVQKGFAAAFDLLAPITGIQLDSHLNGQRVAELIFSADATITKDGILENPVAISGDPIVADDISDNVRDHEVNTNSYPPRDFFNHTFDLNFSSDYDFPCPKQDSASLMTTLPGFSDGKMESLSRGLYLQMIKNSDE